MIRFTALRLRQELPYVIDLVLSDLTDEIERPLWSRMKTGVYSDECVSIAVHFKVVGVGAGIRGALHGVVLEVIRVSMKSVHIERIVIPSNVQPGGPVQHTGLLQHIVVHLPLLHMLNGTEAGISSVR